MAHSRLIGPLAKVQVDVQRELAPRLTAASAAPAASTTSTTSQGVRRSGLGRGFLRGAERISSDGDSIGRFVLEELPYRFLCLGFEFFFDFFDGLFDIVEQVAGPV